MGKRVTGYICTITHDHELGCDAMGTTIYPSVGALKKNTKCWKKSKNRYCGIVEVEITYKRTMQEGTI